MKTGFHCHPKIHPQTNNCIFNHINEQVVNIVLADGANNTDHIDDIGWYRWYRPEHNNILNDNWVGRVDISWKKTRWARYNPLFRVLSYNVEIITIVWDTGRQ